ncbi:MAG TPA: glycoside hydrolase family 36 protein [Chthoniobacterales bacterium]
MFPPILSSFPCSDLLLRYPHDPGTGRVGFEIIPAALANKVQPRRDGLAGLPYIDAQPGAGNPPAFVVDSLAQVKILGDAYSPGFAQGHTMRSSPSVESFVFGDQEVIREGERTEVVTSLRHPGGYRLVHRAAWWEGDAAVGISTAFHNDSEATVTLEMLSSFSLGGLSPFDSADSSGRLIVHRFRSGWSAEGRLESRSIEELHLERSWQGGALFSERFGQIGSMPVRKWFPFAAVEDTAAGVTWGVQLAWAGSWQIEISRQHDDVWLSGGLADREFGHWKKTLQPGESLVSPPATLSCVQGGLDELCDRLTAVQHRAADRHPAVEHDLPIIFNEWCTTWGDPRHDRLAAIARRLQGSEARYLVIDAGWYKQGGASWEYGHGDWIPNAELFPHGLEGTAAAIREAGFIPGLWFEMETCGRDSTGFSLVDRLLQRDGRPLTVRGRRFWNLNDPEVIAFLTRRVIDVLERGNFGYLKVDYNETMGLGSDHPDGLGEGLRQQIEGIYRFFDLIRRRLPGLVLENCASGGHRLEPSMLERTAMSSFSDAHELPEIPIIAANLHLLLLPRQSQIWAVLHSADSEQRLVYSLAATFLGRMCLSGEIDRLDSRQLDLVRQAERLYRQTAPIIKHGTSRRVGAWGPSWRHPRGWQAVVRQAADQQWLLVVVHAFESSPAQIHAPLPAGSWRIAGALGNPVQVADGSLVCPGIADFSARVAVLRRAP